MITRFKALRIRALAVEAAGELDDANASNVPELFPNLTEDGSLVAAGTRINWYGQLKKAAVDLWDTTENNPDHAPELWEDINYVNGYRVIPEIITAGLAFAKGEKGVWKGVLYESLNDANVWTPEQFAAGWKRLLQGG